MGAGEAAGRFAVVAGRVLAVVPALNEAATVAGVVAATRDELGADVLVVDDGSSDATATEAAKAGATVARHPFNLGVGVAMRTGFRYAARHGYDALVQVDADGQHPPDEAVGLVSQVLAGDADIVVGSRFAGDGPPPYPVSLVRRGAMRVLARRVSRRLGVPITDATSGLRAFGPAAIDRLADAYPGAYLSDTVETLLLAGQWGLRVEEVPVTMHPRAGGEASSGGFRSTYHLARVLVVMALFDVRRPLHEEWGR